MLYQLSYIHHGRLLCGPYGRPLRTGRERVYRLGRDARAQVYGPRTGPAGFAGLGCGSGAPVRTGGAGSGQAGWRVTYCAAIFFAVSESGPGAGTNTASR